MSHQAESRRAFTLIELLVVIATSTATISADVLSPATHADNSATPTVARALGSIAEEAEDGVRDILYGEPLDLGKVIVVGRVLASPYRVGSRGQEIFVNGERVAVLSATRRKPAQAATDPRQSRPVARLVVTIERRLLEDQTLLVFDEQTRVFGQADIAAHFVNCLVDAKSLRERVLVALRTDLQGAEAVTTSQWRAALADFELTDDLKQFLSEWMEIADPDGETEGQAGLAVSKRDATSQRMYALNVIGMILAVLAAGKLLNWRPEAAGNWRTVADSEPQIRLVGHCLFLIVVLSVFDLLCTLLVGATGHFEELNPFAHSLIATPAMLTAFKLTATAIGAGILWSLRRYAGAQIASWWLCLLLTILTARWVTVQSLFFA